MFELVESAVPNAVIKVIGVGGGGGNAVNHMVNATVEGVEFICANTDAQALRQSSAKTLLQLGGNVTKGLGAGAKPEVGRQAALEDRERISEALAGADMVFITCGMGGGTGTGAAPEIAKMAKEMGILTVAVVTKPFAFEGAKRRDIALAGLEALAPHADSLIIIPNDKLLTVLGKDVNMLNAFRAANDVLLGAVQGIADLITRPGLINVDFADVRTVMFEKGMAMMGTGTGRGEDRALAAAEAAIHNPLLEDLALSGATGVLVNIASGPSFTMREFEEIGKVVQSAASDDANVVIGTVIDPEMQEEVRVTVVATGLNRQAQARVLGRALERGPGSDEAGRREAAVAERPMRMVRNATTGAIEAAPSVRPSSRFGMDSGAGASAAMQDDYLNIPTFLRKQAD